MTTNPLNIPVSPTTNNRLFVGDSRPEQVMFREGLLYVARTVRLSDLQINWLGTSTVLYDIIKTCATAAPAPACGAYSTTGGGLSAPALALETEWFNGISVPDPGGNLNGFGFYQPMFESPADVISSGPVSPVNLLPWFDKLFVGMTTGGTSNTAAIFSKNFPSLWDFRPGDDAFDTVQPSRSLHRKRVQHLQLLHRHHGIGTRVQWDPAHRVGPDWSHCRDVLSRHADDDSIDSRQYGFLEQGFHRQQFPHERHLYAHPARYIGNCHQITPLSTQVRSGLHNWASASGRP